MWPWCPVLSLLWSVGSSPVKCFHTLHVGARKGLKYVILLVLTVTGMGATSAI
jgi:hypothetical protein